MASSVTIGFGTLFQRGDGGGPEVFTTVGEVISITPPNQSRDSIEVTHTSSTGRVREFKPGLIDGGEVSIEINYVPGSTADDNMQSDLANTSAKNYKILYVSNEYIIFPGFITSIEPGAPIDDRLTATITFKVSGAPTFS